MPLASLSWTSMSPVVLHDLEQRQPLLVRGMAQRMAKHSYDAAIMQRPEDVLWSLLAAHACLDPISPPVMGTDFFQTGSMQTSRKATWRKSGLYEQVHMLNALMSVAAESSCLRRTMPGPPPAQGQGRALRGTSPWGSALKQTGRKSGRPSMLCTPCMR